MDRVSDYNNFDDNKFVLVADAPQMKGTRLFYKEDRTYTSDVKKATVFTMEAATAKQKEVKVQQQLELQIIALKDIND